MRLKDMLLILLSVVASACVSLWVSFHWPRSAGDYLQVKGIELVDDHHKVRGRIGMVPIGRHEVPRLELLDEEGQTSVQLALNSYGEATLCFNAPGTECKVHIGYISGSDVLDSEGEIRDAQNTLGAWGIDVMGPGFQRNGVGFANTGQRFVPTR